MDTLKGLNARTLWAAVVFAAALFCTIVANAAAPSWMPNRSCKDAWSKLIRNDAHQYDYAVDAKPTAEGNRGYADYAARVAREDCYKEWTVLVYMAGDNDLSPYALLDLYEMEAGFESGTRLAGSTLKLDLVVQADTEDDDRVRRLHMFQTPDAYDRSASVETFKSRRAAQVASPIVELLDESTLPKSEDAFREFLAWGVKRYPAKNYVVIVWGHGQGWTAGALPSTAAVPRILAPEDVASPLGLEAVRVGRAESLPSVFGGIGFDAGTKDFLSIPALSRALGSVVRDELEGNPFALYVSDACLMQMAEVASEIAGSAQFIVGSTQVQDFLGLPYRRILSEINNGRYGGVPAEGPDGSADVYRVARMIPAVFRASMTKNGLQGRHNPEGIKYITLSTLSSSVLTHELVPSVGAVGSALLAYVDEEPLRAVDLEYLLAHSPSYQGGAQDLAAFLGLVENLVNAERRQTKATELTPAQRQLLAALSRARDAARRTVVAHVLGTNYTRFEDKLGLIGVRGLTVWLPASKNERDARREDFARSAFFRQNPDWAGFLGTLFGE